MFPHSSPESGRGGVKGEGVWGGGVEKDRATGGRPALPRPCRPEKRKGKKTRKMAQIGFCIHTVAWLMAYGKLKNK
jgi:hypothetical protein